MNISYAVDGREVRAVDDGRLCCVAQASSPFVHAALYHQWSVVCFTDSKSASPQTATAAAAAVTQQSSFASVIRFWHKAHCKVTPVQRTLGTFYRPASVTGVIWTMIHGSAESVNQKRSTAATLCDSGISTSIVRRPAAAAAAASPDTQT